MKAQKQATSFDERLMDFEEFIKLDFKDNLSIHTENLFYMIPKSCLQMFMDFMRVDDCKKKLDIVKQIAENVKMSQD